MVDTRAELGEMRTFAYDVCKPAGRVGAELTTGELRTVGRVRDRLIFPVPPKIPNMSDFSVPAGNAPLAEYPYPRCERGRGALPEGRPPPKGTRVDRAREIGREREQGRMARSGLVPIVRPDGALSNFFFFEKPRLKSYCARSKQSRQVQLAATPTVVQLCKPRVSTCIVCRGTGADDRGHQWSAFSMGVQRGQIRVQGCGGLSAARRLLTAWRAGGMAGVPAVTLHNTLKGDGLEIWRGRPGRGGETGARAYWSARKINHWDWSHAVRGVRDRSGWLRTCWSFREGCWSRPAQARMRGKPALAGVRRRTCG